MANPVFRQPEPQEDTPFLTARLSRLILLNYEIDPALLAPSLPAHTELDFYEHRTFVSLLGLHFSNPSIYGLPLPFYREYAQVNLRFYVRCRIERGNWHRGVAFINQIVPYRPVAWPARNLFHETVVTRNTDQVFPETSDSSRHGPEQLSKPSPSGKPFRTGRHHLHLQP